MSDFQDNSNVSSLGDIMKNPSSPQHGGYVQGPSNGQPTAPREIHAGAVTMPYTEAPSNQREEQELPSVKTALEGLDARISGETENPTFTTTLEQDAIERTRTEMGLNVAEVTEDAPVQDTIVSRPAPIGYDQLQNAVVHPDYVTEETTVADTVESKPQIKTAEVIELASVRIKKMDDKTRDKRLKEVREQRKKFGMTTQVVMPLSMYAPVIGKASSMEVAQLRASSEDEYTYNHRLLSFLYSKMESTNVGKISFNDMLNMTSIYEEEIIYYGLFNSTYPEQNSYPLKCKKCNNPYDQNITNQELIAIKEERRNQLFDLELVRTAGFETAKAIFENSVVGTIERIKMPSGDIIDVRHPSLFDKLEKVMKNIDAAIVEKKAEAASIAIYVDKILIEDGVDANGEPEYLAIENTLEIIDELYDMSDDDFYILMKFIEEKAVDSVIKFAIPKHSCPNCGVTVEETELSIRDLLFIQRAHRLTE